MKNRLLPPLLPLPSFSFAADAALRDTVARKLAAEYPSLEAIYQDLHAHPELSFMETRTAAPLAKELRAAGCEATEKVGHTGVVAVLKNGPGPVVLVRGDMDALPMAEKTGLPYTSTALVKNLAGQDTPAMHPCAHGMHVTGLIGTARVLPALQDRWSGTLVLIGQPDNLLPVVTLAGNRTPVTVNDPALTQRLAGVFREWLGPERVEQGEAATYGEDFSRFGRTARKVPACIFWVGGAGPAVKSAAEKAGGPVPSNHSPFFAPVPEITLKTAVTAMSATVLDLLGKK